MIICIRSNLRERGQQLVEREREKIRDVHSSKFVSVSVISLKRRQYKLEGDSSKSLTDL